MNELEYEYGRGVVANAESSLYWYCLAARAGEANAQKRLSTLGVSYYVKCYPFQASAQCQHLVQCFLNL